MNEAPGSSSPPPAKSVVAASAGARHAARNYAIVTAAYWGFTLTDGALRMLVLLHFYRLGYSPFTLAFLFLLYEAAGVLANLVGGWLATRYGIARMLAVGLVTQISASACCRRSTPDGQRRWRWPGWWWRRASAASPRT
jgi:MFS family permease